MVTQRIPWRASPGVDRHQPGIRTRSWHRGRYGDEGVFAGGNRSGQDQRCGQCLHYIAQLTGRALHGGIGDGAGAPRVGQVVACQRFVPWEANMWAMQGSNLRPPACKKYALMSLHISPCNSLKRFVANLTPGVPRCQSILHSKLHSRIPITAFRA